METGPNPPAHLHLVESEDDPVLEAAKATVLDFGVRRTTVSEVARRAGLSRMTVYRRYPDGAELMRALMAREFGAVLAQARAETEGLPTARERVVGAAVRTVDLLQTQPLLLRLLELEPEMLLPYITDRPGRFQALARDAVRVAIVAGHEDGSIRPGDPAVLAEAIEMAARGLVLSARSLSKRQRAAGLDELRLMVDAYLQPG
jgi:AcrR family transcriptional regulator